MKATVPGHVLLLSLLLGALTAHTARAQDWPTTRWTVVVDDHEDAQSVEIARKHASILGSSSAWFESLGFWPPHQLTADGDLEVDAGETYEAYLDADPERIGSAHGSDGSMQLTSHPGFLSAGTPVWRLFVASPVHELYHGIQGGNGTFPSTEDEQFPGPPECPGENGLDWFTEGTAAAVQIRWLEQQRGIRYGHPFKDSRRSAWVRHFDQPLHHGSLPEDHRLDRLASVQREWTRGKLTSWFCSYGSWYFWYALGDMLGGGDPDRAVAYTKFLYRFTGPWDDLGLANIDAGLKRAAAAYDAIGPYQDGLYDLYPQFVAQYLTDDEFFGHLERVDLGTPGLFETASSSDPDAVDGPIGPLASRAWRIRVHLPDNATPVPHAVRFTLDAHDGSDRDDLHLIVGEEFIGRPVGETTPYTATRRVDPASASFDGAIEYLVRVANVSRDVDDLAPAGFSLRVEVDGYYGRDVSDNDEIPSGVAGELPPGFSVRGPGPWKCSGKRAVFDLVTPDEFGRDIDRAMPEGRRKFENHMDQMELVLEQRQRQGEGSEITQEQLREIREQTLRQIDASIAEAAAEYATSADEARAARTTGIGATFVGKHGGRGCQMTLRATLEGRQGGAQVLAAATDPSPTGETTGFELDIYPASYLDSRRTGGRSGADREGGWEICAMTDETRRSARRRATPGCPALTCTAGRLTLEEATQGRIAGTFQFEVVHWPAEKSACPVPDGRDTVVGHFNVTSTDDGYGNNSMHWMDGGSAVIPGTPIIDLEH